MPSSPDVLLISTLPGLLRPARETLHLPGGVLSLGEIAGLSVAVSPAAVVDARWVMTVALTPSQPPVRPADVIVPTGGGVDPTLLRIAREVPEDDWLPEHYSPVAHLDRARRPESGAGLAIYGAAPPGIQEPLRADAGDAAVSFARAVVAHLARSVLG
ncbi:hypothetical protein KZZ52_02560 [Dactylosporangium sp. AC04546]|uniref:hypothetical protein n=1 Tax=Dactylosporangium sp. AC04546 TaxID=2862460 RepID=UPI001EE0E0DA|nr:hypothetical protein [Dactylosporangium sp. AC04546]WVK84337.1 hypothetical protein KZZ52_02560 [Dactylosporangium sp. AC04546]